MFIKAVLGDDVRLFSLNKTNTTYGDLEIRIRQVFKRKILQEEVIIMKYKDEDGDLITITDDDILLFALESSSVPKLFIFLNEPLSAVSTDELIELRNGFRAIRDQANYWLDRLESRVAGQNRQNHFPEKLKKNYIFIYIEETDMDALRKYPQIRTKTCDMSHLVESTKTPSVNENEENEPLENSSEPIELVYQPDVVHVSENPANLYYLKNMNLPVNNQSTTEEIETVDVDYEIYEGFPEKIVLNQCDYNNAFEEDQKKMGFPVCLYEELKDAIIKKASEHQMREAKALGVDVSQVSQHFLNGVLEKEDRKAVNGEEKTNEGASSSLNQELVNRQIDSTQKTQLIEERQNVFAFHSNLVVDDEDVFLLSSPSSLAADAVRRGKGMEINMHEECFGSEEESETDG